MDQVAEVERVLRKRFRRTSWKPLPPVPACSPLLVIQSQHGPHTSVISATSSERRATRLNQRRTANTGQTVSRDVFDRALVKHVTSFGSQKSIDVEIYGYDFPERPAPSSAGAEIMHKIPGMADIEVSREEELPW